MCQTHSPNKVFVCDYFIITYLILKIFILGVYDFPLGVVYPGIVDGVFYNISTLKTVLQPVRDFQLAFNIHILFLNFISNFISNFNH